ncbi:hypothetical protein F5148DRAFT_1214326 [Russula earlei]|uniref:Uncharacterized protein n=1 Tax=Russula earlei TaxID=71964 RepID=A0ACC0U4Z8_9AGAM|nr:hypothetical protein F5148DRAFT_1214326 [Russula earlei]
MIEYVYARHDFVPEHDDEIAFRAGDRIEVIEKDDLYNDGWWQGRNLAGNVGLFPESYTQPAPPNSVPPLAAAAANGPTSLELTDNSPSSAVSLPSTKQAPPQALPETSSHTDDVNRGVPNPSAPSSNGEVMRATITDVQKAIEQLGHKDDFDGSRSFTFSSRDESTDHETDHDTDADVDGEAWHKSARQRLAEKAKMAAEEQAARDAAESRVPLRSIAPPIDVELSDDSGDEADGPSPKTSPDNHLRQHPHIPEEEEDDITAPNSQTSHQVASSPSIQPSERFIVPSPISTAPRPDSEPTENSATETEGNISTATQRSFPQTQTARIPGDNSSLPSPVSPGLRGISNGASAAPSDAASHPLSTQLVFPSKTQTLSSKEVTGVLPSPAASSNGHRYGYSVSSIASSARTAASPSQSAARSADLSNKRPRGDLPTEWTVEEVVDWLRSKGFDKTVCDKFIEQEITGDILLELDVAVLKSEIGIVAYGKRIRIANAITELRRPPSVLSSSAEHPTRPGSSFHGSPLAQHGTTLSHATHGSAALESLASPESPPDSGNSMGQPSMPTRRESDPGVRSPVNDSNTTVGLGLGIPPSLLAGGSQGKAVKMRPPQLSLSPSDPEIGVSIKSVPVGQRILYEDREVLSDSDTKDRATNDRGHLFGRKSSSSSTGKLSLSPRSPGEVTTPRSDMSDGSRLRPQPRKRSLDATRENSRLSFFGSSIVGTLGKARKPPPRYSSTTPDPEASPDRGALSLSRFYPGSGGRKTSSRSMANGGKEDKREKRDSRDSSGTKERKDVVLLRKPASPIMGRSSTLKSGQSILEQIGEPDHKGWMRKRGERYNSWKNRYFVLKGPHLYWLRSNNASETKIKGYVNIVGYRMLADENIDPGRYGFKLLHESDRSHFFSSDEQMVVREWMRALMKATIDRDYTKPVVSSVNVPTIPLAVAQAMNPAPRPPSPTARAATQRAMRRENTNQLSTRDAEILMSITPTVLSGNLNANGGGRQGIESVFSKLEMESPVSPSTSPKYQTPPVRPPREMRRNTSMSEHPPVEPDLIEWANSHLPDTLQITSKGSVCGGLELLRIAESIKGLRASPVPDSVFPRGPHDDTLEGLFSLFDFLLDNDVKMGTVSINDVRQGRRDKIIQLLKALRAWEEKRHAVLRSIGTSSMQAGPFVA